MTTVVAKSILQSITTKGAMPFVEFMQHALYTPGSGYYSSGRQKFGKAGDFITAPELSPLFSRCIARQCQQILPQFNSPIILEFGAGSGVMAVDLLLQLEAWDILPDAYWILELSAELQSRQRQLFKERAPHLLHRVSWLSALPSPSFEGIVLANEVLDAMPVHKFRIHAHLQEAYVAVKDEQFVWHWDQPSNTLEAAIQHLQMSFSNGYESEINLFIGGWLKSLSSCLSNGLVLIVDYGFPRHEYYHPDRSMGTIMCHYQHRAHSDPLRSVGLQDVSAHVDFTAVAEAAVENNFEVAGYTNQASFLINCGITDLLQNAQDDIERFNWSNQVKQLTLPSEMGELFKVIALTKHVDVDLLGFYWMDQLERL